jgi:hypothetical protein
MDQVRKRLYCNIVAARVARRFCLERLRLTITHHFCDWNARLDLALGLARASIFLLK